MGVKAPPVVQIRSCSFVCAKVQDVGVPFVNRPFESEIHGTVNFTYFCCFLLVTWCHCVLLSCYLRPK